MMPELPYILVGIAIGYVLNSVQRILKEADKYYGYRK
jgi:hypothetical protein